MIKYYRSCLEQSNGIKIDSLTITSPPTKTIYIKGDTIDTTGLEVIATSGKMTGNVTSHCAITPQVLDTEGTQDVTIYYGGVTASFQTTVLPASISLEDASWDMISDIGANGLGSQYWAIGDDKSITVNGQVGGNTTLSNYQTKVYIIDFNYRNTNGIYFQGFRDKSTDKDVVIVESSGSNVIKFNMNHWGAYNYGGWKGCDLRYDILGSTDVPPSDYGIAHTTTNVGYDASDTCATNPVPNTLMSALPSDLRNVLKPITIYTDNTGGTSTTSSAISSSIDYLPLFSCYELIGTTDDRANVYESSYQTRFKYYALGASHRKRSYKAPSSTDVNYYWLRSPSRSNNTAYTVEQNANRCGHMGAGTDEPITVMFRVA